MIDLLQFITDTNSAASEEQIIECFKNALRHIGFDKFRYGFITEHHTINKPIDHAIAYNFPEDWMKYYIEKGYFDIDPVKKMIPMMRAPFDWDHINMHQKLSKKEQEFMNLAKDAGLVKGVGLSVHTAYGEVAGFGFASGDKNLVITNEILGILHMLSMQFHNAYMELHKIPNPSHNRIILTAREKDVLTWLAMGKSVGVIAQILGISENSVGYYMKNCYKKLEANTKIMAVTKALYLGLIEPQSLK